VRISLIISGSLILLACIGFFVLSFFSAVDPVSITAVAMSFVSVSLGLLMIVKS